MKEVVSSPSCSSPAQDATRPSPSPPTRRRPGPTGPAVRNARFFDSASTAGSSSGGKPSTDTFSSSLSKAMRHLNPSIFKSAPEAAARPSLPSQVKLSVVLMLFKQLLEEGCFMQALELVKNLLACHPHIAEATLPFSLGEWRNALNQCKHDCDAAGVLEGKRHHPSSEDASRSSNSPPLEPSANHQLLAPPQPGPERGGSVLRPQPDARFMQAGHIQRQSQMVPLHYNRVAAAIQKALCTSDDDDNNDNEAAAPISAREAASPAPPADEPAFWRARKTDDSPKREMMNRRFQNPQMREDRPQQGKIDLPDSPMDGELLSYCSDAPATEMTSSSSTTTRPRSTQQCTVAAARRCVPMRSAKSILAQVRAAVDEAQRAKSEDEREKGAAAIINRSIRALG